MGQGKTYVRLIRKNEDVFRDILRDIRDNGRGVKFPDGIDPGEDLDTLLFGPTIKKKERIEANEAFVEVQSMYGKRDCRGATLIYEIRGRVPVYARECDRWEGMEYRKGEEGK